MTLEIAARLRAAPPRAALRDIPPFRQIVEGPITLVAHCSTHGMPYFGKAFVGYVPTSERLGPSMLRRIVLQAARYGEGRLDQKIASMLAVCIRPAGVALALRSSHDCAGPRLIEDEGPRAVWHGRYRSDRSLRAEFLDLCATDRAVLSG